MPGFRDRDAPISKEGIIFRTYGYSHPPNACFCDVEYAPSTIYTTTDPRAIRTGPQGTFYKFYSDGGLQFIKTEYPDYQILNKTLQRKLAGVTEAQAVEVRLPDARLQEILKNPRQDALIQTVLEILELIKEHSQLKPRDFGVFGSILHDFYHVDYSDVDFIIYGRRNLQELRETLADFYQEKSFPMQNEFAGWDSTQSTKHWYFKNYSLQEYPTYELRKLIYGIIRGKKMRRPVKIEFEPVKNWNEIYNEYPETVRIEPEGWIRAIAEVTDDRDAFFMESKYKIEVLEILEGPKVEDINRILSFVEEYRGQVFNNEEVLVTGNLEKVITHHNEFHQITLSYGPKYYDQTLKINKR